jgi:YebC/PmpR family DNA-binding regulatory protein
MASGHAGEGGEEAMSGHSKWHQIRRQKGVNDAKRGQLFTRLGRELVVAVREGGGPDPDANFRLRMAIQRAREANMPMDNIDRTIKRASGGGEGVQLEEITYEGYAPGGAAIMVQVMTDNRNRAAAEVRNVFNKNAGNLGEMGCVDWIFEPRGVIEVSLDGRDPDELSLEAIDAGAEDVDPTGPDDTELTIYTEPANLEAARTALEAKKITVLRAESTLVPKTKIELSEKEAMQTLRLIDRLEDLDDVQNVYTNAEIANEFAEKYEG